MSPRIITLTLNPAVDRSGNVHGLKPSEKLRCTDDRTDAGGGGINVARMLTRLGADVLALFPAGGLTGQMLARLLEAEHIRFEALPTQGETRENVSIRDTASGEQYRFVFPGTPMTPVEITACCERALEHLGPGSWLVASGSLPPGAAPATYRQLAKQAVARGARFVLDSSGEALRLALGPELEIVKVNEAELEEMTGVPVHDHARCMAAAHRLLESGVKMVAVTRGSRGALLVTQSECWKAVAPSVSVVSTVGAGDSFLAALVMSLAAGKSTDQAAQTAVAAGCAALLAAGTGLARPSDIARLADKVEMLPVMGTRLQTAAEG